MERSSLNTVLRVGLLAVVVLLLSAPTMATRLRVSGTVTDHFSREPLANALVRVYRDGVKQQMIHTGANGRYNVVLDNHAQYVIRFSLPGHVTKCFAIDTRGGEWEGDNRMAEVEVEMTLFEAVPTLDLGWFDMPMGMARFDPTTGFIAWNGDYERRINPEVARLMAEVTLRREALVADQIRASRGPARP